MADNTRNGDAPKATPLAGATKVVDAPSTVDGSWATFDVPEPLPPRRS